MSDSMRSEFEKRFPIPDGVAWKDSGNYGVVARGQRAMLSASSYRAMWQAWQACAARMVPDAAASILADVINALENGFVRCETCGDQEDTATLDCMDDLRKIHAMIAAAPEPKK